MWLALSRDTRVDPMDEDSLAAKLVKHGASPDAINNITGDWSLSLLLLLLLLVLKMTHYHLVSSLYKAPDCRAKGSAEPNLSQTSTRKRRMRKLDV